MVKYILLIMNCEKYSHKRENQINGWLKNICNNDILYFHVIGKKIEHHDYLFDFSNNILYVNTPDDYISLPKKVISSFNAINNYYNGQYEYIFKTDDDQISDVASSFFKNLIKLLESKITVNDKIHYGGYIVNVLYDHVSKYYTIHKELPKDLIIQRGQYCSGRFYLLSKDAIVNLIEKKEHFYKEYFEDYAVGKYLDTTLKEKKISIETSKIFSDMPNNIIL